MIIYYAHFRGLYYTHQEKRDLATIRKIFPEADIINPSEPQYQKGFITSGLKMEYFLGLVREADLLIFRGLVNGKIGAGCWAEIQEAREKGIPVLELPGFVGRETSVEDTEQMLKELGRI